MQKEIHFLGTGCSRCGRVKEHALSVLLDVGTCEECGRAIDDDCFAAHTDNAFRRADGAWQLYEFGGM